MIRQADDSGAVAQAVVVICAAVATLALCQGAQAHGLDMLAQAQPSPARNPFNVGISEGGSAPQGGLAGWIWAQQIKFERMLSGAVRAIKSDTAAFWTLLGISFAYGAFHAAGPGHGKAVVAAYMFANERALKRGLAISAMAAVLQAVVAVVIVGVLAWLFNASARTMKSAANFVEIASFAGIALLGLWLVWRKGKAFLQALTPAPVGHSAGAAAAHGHDHHGHEHHGHAHHSHAHAHHDHGLGHTHAHHHDPHHVHDEHCGHFHAPDPKTLGDGFSWKVAIATVFAAGSRPCSGAILVLVFALAQGIFLAGIAAAFAMAAGTALTTGALAAAAVLAKGLAIRLMGEGGGKALVLVRVLELVAALLVLLLGVILFTGSLGR